MAAQDDCRTIFERWHEALISGDNDAMLELYAEDATLESPLVAAVLGRDSGICEGKDEIRHFLTETFRYLADRTGPVDSVRGYRTGEYFCDGGTLIWEYPRATPEGDQSDIVEVMELGNGRIRHHRIYWGWVGVRDLVRHAGAESKAA